MYKKNSEVFRIFFYKKFVTDVSALKMFLHLGLPRLGGAHQLPGLDSIVGVGFAGLGGLLSWQVQSLDLL